MGGGGALWWDSTYLTHQVVELVQLTVTVIKDGVVQAGEEAANPSMDTQLLEPKGIRGLDQDSGNGVACQILCGWQSASCQGCTSMNNHVDRDFFVHCQPNDMGFVKDIGNFLCKECLFLPLSSCLGTMKVACEAFGMVCISRNNTVLSLAGNHGEECVD